MLTIVGGKVVCAVSGFSKLALPELPVSPAWSPVAKYGGYAQLSKSALGASDSVACAHTPSGHGQGGKRGHLEV